MATRQQGVLERGSIDQRPAEMAVFLGFPAEGSEEAYSYPTTETDGVSTATSRQQVRLVTFVIN